MRYRLLAGTESPLMPTGIGDSGFHVTGTLRISTAQSSVAEPAGKRVVSSKKEEWAARISTGSTCHALVRSSSPSRQRPSLVSEYPVAPCRKKLDASPRL